MQTAQKEKELLIEKLEAEKELAEYKGMQDLKKSIVDGGFAYAAKEGTKPLPPYMTAIINHVMPNIVLDFQQENQEMAQEIAAKQQQELQQAQMQQELANMSPEEQQQVMAEMQQQEMQMQ